MAKQTFDLQLSDSVSEPGWTDWRLTFDGQLVAGGAHPTPEGAEEAAQSAAKTHTSKLLSDPPKTVKTIEIDEEDLP